MTITNLQKLFVQLYIYFPSVSEKLKPKKQNKWTLSEILIDCNDIQSRKCANNNIYRAILAFQSNHPCPKKSHLQKFQSPYLPKILALVYYNLQKFNFSGGSAEGYPTEYPMYGIPHEERNAPFIIEPP